MTINLKNKPLRVRMPTYALYFWTVLAVVSSGVFLLSDEHALTGFTLFIPSLLGMILSYHKKLKTEYEKSGLDANE